MPSLLIVMDNKIKKEKCLKIKNSIWIIRNFSKFTKFHLKS